MQRVVLDIRLLGGAGVRKVGESPGLARLSAQKGLALIAYLAMNPGPIERAQLADLLWGDRIDRQARQSLRQCLVTLRRDLGEAACALKVDDRALALDPAALTVDALAFQRYAAATEISEQRRCLDLPSGAFLAGLHIGAEAFDLWAEEERSRLAALGTRIFTRLADHCERTGDGEGAILALERLVALDLTEEEWQQRLLQSVDRHQGAEAALARAKWLTCQLRQQLDAEPSLATRSIMDEIRRSAHQARERTPAPLLPITQTHDEAPAAASVPSGAGDEAAETPAAPIAPQPDLAAVPAAETPASLSQQRHRLRIAATLAIVIALGTTVDAPGSRHAPSAVVEKPARTTVSAAPDSAWRSPEPLSRRASEDTKDIHENIIPIAVLPFKTYGEQAESLGLLTEMMNDDLINMLSRVPNFRVISRQTSRLYQGQEIDIAVIGAELGVRYILEGAVRLHGDRMRVNVELINPATRLPVWSGRIERDGAARHTVQDEIVGRLARELQFELYPIESERRSADPRADALAYRGWGAMFAAFSQSGARTFKAAEALFRQALERNPQHFSAQMGLAAYHANMGAQLHDANSREHLDRAQAIMRELVARRPNHSAAQFYLGLALQARGELREAIEVFERAIELNPSNASAHAHIGHALARMGRPAEGLEHIHYAMRLSPRDPGLAYWLEFAGGAELELNNTAQAIECFRRAAALNPTYPRAWAGLVAAYALAGNADEARAHIDQLRTFAPNLNAEGLIARFGRRPGQAPRLREGLRLALTPPA